MSWDQGIQLREELPDTLIKFLEAKYQEIYAESGSLEYITWFGSGKEAFADFGNERSLKIILDI